MTLTPTLQLRRDVLLRAVQTLPPLTLKVFIHLLASACPHTARVWTSVLRIETALGLSTGVVTQALDTLTRERFISVTVVHGNLWAIEIGHLLIRDDEAPPNLPVEDL